MPRPLHLLPAHDLEWALDNGRREYRVRQSQTGDIEGRPRTSDPHLIAIVRLHDGFRIVLTKTCLGTRMPFEDSDAYALHRLDIINRKRRQTGKAEV